MAQNANCKLRCCQNSVHKDPYRQDFSREIIFEKYLINYKSFQWSDIFAVSNFQTGKIEFCWILKFVTFLVFLFIHFLPFFRLSFLRFIHYRSILSNFLQVFGFIFFLYFNLYSKFFFWKREKIVNSFCRNRHVYLIGLCRKII